MPCSADKFCDFIFPYIGTAGKLPTLICEFAGHPVKILDALAGIS